MQPIHNQTNPSIDPFYAGIVFYIAKLVLDNNGDIQESRMMRMGCDFTLMMVRFFAQSDSTDTIHPTAGQRSPNLSGVFFRYIPLALSLPERSD